MRVLEGVTFADILRSAPGTYYDYPPDLPTYRPYRVNYRTGSPSGIDPDHPSLHWWYCKLGFCPYHYPLY